MDPFNPDFPSFMDDRSATYYGFGNGNDMFEDLAELTLEPLPKESFRHSSLDLDFESGSALVFVPRAEDEYVAPPLMLPLTSDTEEPTSPTKSHSSSNRNQLQRRAWTVTGKLQKQPARFRKFGICPNLTTEELVHTSSVPGSLAEIAANTSTPSGTKEKTKVSLVDSMLEAFGKNISRANTFALITLRIKGCLAIEREMKFRRGYNALVGQLYPQLVQPVTTPKKPKALVPCSSRINLAEQAAAVDAFLMANDLGSPNTTAPPVRTKHVHNSSVRLRCSTAASASTGREESHTKSSLITEKDLDKLADMVRESGAGRKLGSEAEPFKFNMLVESKNRRQSCSSSLTHLNNDALMASSSKRGMVLPSVPQWTEFLFESSSIAASDRSRSASEATTSSSVFAVPSIHDAKRRNVPGSSAAKGRGLVRPDVRLWSDFSDSVSVGSSSNSANVPSAADVFRDCLMAPVASYEHISGRTISREFSRSPSVLSDSSTAPRVIRSKHSRQRTSTGRAAREVFKLAVDGALIAGATWTESQRLCSAAKNRLDDPFGGPSADRIRPGSSSSRSNSASLRKVSSVTPRSDTVCAFRLKSSHLTGIKRKRKSESPVARFPPLKSTAVNTVRSLSNNSASHLPRSIIENCMHELPYRPVKDFGIPPQLKTTVPPGHKMKTPVPPVKRTRKPKYSTNPSTKWVSKGSPTRGAAPVPKLILTKGHKHIMREPELARLANGGSDRRRADTVPRTAAAFYIGGRSMPVFPVSGRTASKDRSKSILASSTSKETSAALHKVNYPSKSNPTACGLIYESVLKVRPFYPEPSMERETLDKRDVVTIPGKNAVKINPTKDPTIGTIKKRVDASWELFW